MNKPHFLLLPLALLAACGAPSPEAPPLAGAKIGAPFTLTDQNNRPVRWEDFNGKYRIVYFGYSYCPDVCPVDLQAIMQAYRQFEKQSPTRAVKIAPIFISLDPERDTPATLKAYAANFDPRLIALSGTPEQIAAVARSFVIVYGKEGGSKGGKDYLVSHSRTPYLFGPKGEPIALIPVDDAATSGTQEGTPADIVATLDKWVK